MNNSRRSFVKKSLTILAAAPAVVAIQSSAHAQAAPTTAVDLTNPTAMALGYVEDHTKVDVAKYPKKAEASGAKQYCSTCMLYQKGGLTAQGKTGEYGVCSLFPTGLVAANGWCMSWAPKAA